MKIIFTDEFQAGTYVFPEKSMNPFALYEWLQNVELKADDVIVTTNDYVIKEINVKIMRGDIKAKDIEAISKWDKKVEVDAFFGIELKSIDAIIDRQNLICKELMWSNEEDQDNIKPLPNKWRK